MIVRPRGRWLAGSVCFLLPLVALPSIDHQFTTVASWYGPGFQGRKTASGEVFDQEKMTAASRTLPFGTKLLVQNPHNGKVCAVVINDRGPYVNGRGLDLSHAAARHLGISGIGPVVCYVEKGREPAYSRHKYSAPRVAPDVEPDTIAYRPKVRDARRNIIAWRAPNSKVSMGRVHSRRLQNNNLPPLAPSISRVDGGDHRTWNDESFLASAPPPVAPPRKIRLSRAVGHLAKGLAHVDKFLGGVLASL
ncbi:MAG TPA: septal ring lytic transglycosylase RlpA family protein [Trichormus sp.]|jgi:hypothetical protein